MSRARWAVVLALCGLGCVGGSRASGGSPEDALARGDALSRADALYARSRYEEAEAAYAEHLSARPDDPQNDRVLLRQALLYLFYGVPDRDPERGEESLRELTARYPASPFREAADYMLALRREVAELRADSARVRQRSLEIEEQLEALKRIDEKRSDTP